jgi:hypothetical protein
VTAIDSFIDDLRTIPDNEVTADAIEKWLDEQHPDTLDAVTKVLVTHRRNSIAARLDLMHAEIHRLANLRNGWTQ